MRQLLLPCYAVAAVCPPNSVSFPDAESVSCENPAQLRDEAYSFLSNNMPPWDRLNDLENQHIGGIIVPTINISVASRATPFAAKVPKDVWLDAVLPYASTNEARNNWREKFNALLKPEVAGPSYVAQNLSDAVVHLNSVLWTVLREGQSAVVFKSQQTPLIYDPMSTLFYGYASCTGISIMFVDALRSVGIPARVVGTPAWNGKEANGNHNWVEVWLGSEIDPGCISGKCGWTFLEGAPAGGGETLTNPCDKWFCTNARMAAGSGTQVFSTMFSRTTNDTYYRMSWSPSNLDVPGTDRTAYYQASCTKCGTKGSQAASAQEFLAPTHHL
eukprot:CAMPEP_0204354560 /NCGR_PEP_ID=MMETSP0469-20131031/33496_1 /ASSEMBLY_ACC=CAM_ASM_000384 /TAXON_ID=2969 /ORGANISM="Oxyrrhis marina" /LENGTH=329 /DNA_ID=CAMNT_0051341673 /DNA_START=52 /DNA_END=1041 /DNA_ORIENTATION=-